MKEKYKEKKKNIYEESKRIMEKKRKIFRKIQKKKWKENLDLKRKKIVKEK